MKKFLLSALLVGSFGVAHAQLGGFMNKVKQQASEAVSTKTGTKAGTNTGTNAAPTDISPDDVQPDACISNVQSICDIIVGTYYKEYSNNPKAFIQKDGGMWFARKDLEVARFYYTGGQQGFRSMGRQCDQGAATKDPRYQPLKAQLAAAEAKVVEMEKAKGIVFVAVRGDTNVIFKNAKTGKEYTSGESNHL